MEELATALRRERWILSLLVFRLTELRHLLTDNDARFLGWASAEVEDAATRVREAELVRDTLVSGLGDFAVMPEPYGEIVAEHLGAISALAAEIQALRAGCAQLASDAIAACGDTDDFEVELALGGYRAALATAEHLRLQTLTESVR
jgi:hypothetical protein